MLKALLPGWLRGPLEIELSLDDRPYTLGETANVTVELTSRKDVEVSEGRVELVCHETWAETWMKQETMGRSPGMIRRGAELPGPITQRREVKEFNKSFVHSTATFGEAIRVRPDTPARLNVRLDIGVERPPHAQGGTLAWSLVTTVETSGGRTVTDSREVTVSIP